MRLAVRHHTEYRYDRPVGLEPHAIRLRPRADATVEVIKFRLDVDPAPARLVESIDPEGNLIALAWFSGTTDVLRVRTELEVATSLSDPYAFLLLAPERRLPYEYPAGPTRLLAPYRNEPHSVAASVREFAERQAEEAGRVPTEFLTLLTRTLASRLDLTTRAAGGPRPADQTLSLGEGACRDTAVLFVDCCQAVGLAARFVSGYAHGDGRDSHELHAWAEAYLPGGGWRGFDATEGLAVADRHIPLAAAADPADAAPISGTYRGDVASPTPRLTVEVTRTD